MHKDVDCDAEEIYIIVYVAFIYSYTCSCIAYQLMSHIITVKLNKYIVCIWKLNKYIIMFIYILNIVCSFNYIACIES